MTGMDLPNDRGNVYVRASVLHDWKGDADYTYAWKGESRSLTEELGGTWYEYGLAPTSTPRRICTSMQTSRLPTAAKSTPTTA